MKKRFLKFFAATLIIFIFALAVTPHYSTSCACGDQIVQRNGNKLTYVLKETARFAFNSLVKIWR